MQVKPFFEEYTEHFRIPVIKDDAGTQYSLVKITGTRPKGSLPTHPLTIAQTEFVKVMSDHKDNYSNGTAGYEERLFWREKSKDLLTTTINGYRLEEVESFTHCVFWPYPGRTSDEYGIATKFLVTKCE